MKHILIFLFCCLFSASALAQDWPVVEQNGEKYYLYKVEAGNTLYGISKSFLVEIDDILEANPQLQQGLKAGDELRIPYSRANRNLKKADAPVLQNDKLLHTVQKGETLYSISRQYDIRQEDLMKENPQIREGLKAGMILSITLVPETVALKDTVTWLRHQVQKGETLYSLARRYQVTQDSVLIVNNGLPAGVREGEFINIPIRVVHDHEGRKDTLYGFIRDALAGRDTLTTGPKSVALFLPFFVQKNLEMEAEEKPGLKDLYGPSRVAVTFFQGFSLTLDSLWKDDSVIVRVFDSSNDTLAIRKILDNPELQETDAIVGPLYASSFTVAARYAEARRIPIISPFSQSIGNANHNPWVFKVTPNQEYFAAVTAKNLKQQFGDTVQYVLLNSGSPADSTLRRHFLDSLPQGMQLKQVNVASGIKLIGASLDPFRHNIVILPSVNKSVVTDMITKLYFLEDYSITLVGIEEWLNYDNIDIEYLEKLNLTLAVATKETTDTVRLNAFMEQYRNRYTSETDYYAFHGHDMALLVLGMLNYPEWPIQPVITVNGLLGNYRFERTGVSAGYENRGMRFIRFSDYRYTTVTEK